MWITGFKRFVYWHSSRRSCSLARLACFCKWAAEHDALSFLFRGLTYMDICWIWWRGFFKTSQTSSFRLFFLLLLQMPVQGEYYVCGWTRKKPSAQKQQQTQGCGVLPQFLASSLLRQTVFWPTCFYDPLRLREIRLWLERSEHQQLLLMNDRSS